MVLQRGEKVCTYKFNLEQWKFDYATIPSRDRANRRERMMYIYDVFNHSSDNSFLASNSSHYKSNFAGQNYGEIKYEQNIYDIDKTAIFSKVNEVIYNKYEKGTNEQLVTKNIELSNDPLYTVGKDTLTIIANNMIDKSKLVNKYESSSVVNRESVFKSRCITTDGKANVYLANGSNICYKISDGETGRNVYGQNKYYTSLAATPNSKFSSQITRTGKNHNISGHYGLD